MIPSQPTMSADDIRPRPSSGVVVTLASGPEAGRSFGIDGTSFEVGFDPSCDVALVAEPFPAGQRTPVRDDSDDRRLRVERGATGWSIRDFSGRGFFLNQSFVRSTGELRSGDIIRLTWNGPDLQFWLQSSSQPLAPLVANYLAAAPADPAHRSQVGNPPSGTARETGEVVHRSPANSAPPSDPAARPYSARETRVISTPLSMSAEPSDASAAPRRNPNEVSSGGSSGGGDLRKTMRVSREALAVANAVREENRNRFPVIWVVLAATLLIIGMLGMLGYWMWSAERGDDRGIDERNPVSVPADRADMQNMPGTRRLAHNHFNFAGDRFNFAGDRYHRVGARLHRSGPGSAMLSREIL